MQHDHPDVNLVTALVPSEMACLANSPGKRSLTALCTSLEESVLRLLYLTSLEASMAMRSKVSLMNEFMMFIAFLEIPVSGCTWRNTLQMQMEKVSTRRLWRCLSPALRPTCFVVFQARSAVEGVFLGGIFIF